jgi:LysM repeat protein
MVYVESGQSVYMDAHLVQKGETLYGISRKYGIDIQTLTELNKLKGNVIQPGQRLLLGESRSEASAAPATANTTDSGAAYRTNSRAMAPAQGEAAVGSLSNLAQEEYPAQSEDTYSSSFMERRAQSASAAYSPEEETRIERRIYHEVKPGETLYQIAKRYGVTVEELRLWNSVSSPRAGQTLIVGKQYEVTTLGDLESHEAAIDLRTARMRLENAPAETPAASSKTVNEASGTRGNPEIVYTRGLEPDMPEERANSSTRSMPASESGTYVQVERKEMGAARFYAVHKTLPVGSTFRMRIPGNAGFVEVTVAGNLEAGSRYLVGLSPACVKILSGSGATDGNVTLEYE